MTLALFWIAAALYAFSAGLIAFRVIFKRPSLGKTGAAFLFAAWLVHSLALGWRWSESGHPPLANPPEAALLTAWAVVGVSILVLYTRRRV